MKQQSLTRAAALVAASTLTVGLAATSATAAPAPTGKPVFGSVAADDHSGGHVVGPKAKNKKIERLRKELARAEAERKDAFGEARGAKAEAKKAALALADAQAAVQVATTVADETKAPLTKAQAVVDAAAAVLREAESAVRGNLKEQADVTALVEAAEAARDAADADAATLAASFPSLDGWVEYYTVSVATAQETLDDFNADLTVRLAAADAAKADMDAAAVVVDDARAAFLVEVQPYAEYRVDADTGEVEVSDDSVVWNPLPSATSLYADWEIATADFDAAAAVNTAALADVTETQGHVDTWTATLAERTTALADAEDDVTKAHADHDAAVLASADAAADVDAHNADLDVLVAKAIELNETVTAAKVVVKDAAVVRDAHAAVYAEKAAVLAKVVAVQETAVTAKAAAVAHAVAANADLDEAKDVVRAVKKRLAKARSNR